MLAPLARPPAGLPVSLAEVGRTLVMGVLNVTTDSFSDGGLFVDTPAALRRAEQMLREGADIIDVGGESTRPGASRVAAATEQQRVLPVVRELARQGAVVSVDTMRAQTARAAVQAGAAIINDVSGGLADEAMFDTVAELGVPYVIMHWRGHSERMNHLTDYGDVVAEVAAHLQDRVRRAVAAGIPADRLVLDPGLGFAKEHHHNWQLLRALGELAEPGTPILIGASRKRFLGALLAAADGGPRLEAHRDAATAAISALAAAAGAWCVRVHDVAASADAVRVAAALRDAGGEDEA